MLTAIAATATLTILTLLWMHRRAEDGLARGSMSAQWLAGQRAADPLA